MEKIGSIHVARPFCSAGEFMLRGFFDAVIMLTWSDWHTEPRSNRYHYAKRVSQHLPVIFVQPDRPKGQYEFEATELERVTILHIDEFYGPEQEKVFQR